MSYSVERASGKVMAIRRVADGALIPLDPKNSDYVKFIAWQYAQPTPLDTTDKTPDAPTAAEKRIATARKTLREAFKSGALSPIEEALAILINAAE